ncbi:MAG: hypothetical protein MJ239_04345, partial [Bacilli bacterium]|nr:hypothetical protein [Bacilli bacterium]
MDFNTLLARLGINADNFVNKENEPIRIPGGFIYEVEQSPGVRVCPNCGFRPCSVCGRYTVEVRCSESENMEEVLRVRKVRLRCGKCGRTHSPSLDGVGRHSTVTRQVESFIVSDFTRPLTFAQIAARYGLTRQRVLQMFDDKVRAVPRRRMPRVLCIDEIRFREEIGQNYCCVLYDFERREIVDIVRNRQMPYLREYFSSIPLAERRNTKV